MRRQPRWSASGSVLRFESAIESAGTSGRQVAAGRHPPSSSRSRSACPDGPHARRCWRSSRLRREDVAEAFAEARGWPRRDDRGSPLVLSPPPRPRRCRRAATRDAGSAIGVVANLHIGPQPGAHPRGLGLPSMGAQGASARATLAPRRRPRAPRVMRRDRPGVAASRHRRGVVDRAARRGARARSGIGGPGFAPERALPPRVHDLTCSSSRVSATTRWLRISRSSAWSRSALRGRLRRRGGGARRRRSSGPGSEEARLRWPHLDALRNDDADRVRHRLAAAGVCCRSSRATRTSSRSARRRSRCSPSRSCSWSGIVPAQLQARAAPGRRWRVSATGRGGGADRRDVVLRAACGFRSWAWMGLTTTTVRAIGALRHAPASSCTRRAA